jgi:hypothetical protein
MVVGRRRCRTRGSTSSGAGTSRQLQKITDRDDCDKRDERWVRTQILAASLELLLSYSPPSCLGMPPVSRGLNRKTWWDHDAMNIPFKCLGEKITEDEMERKKEFIPEEWAMGAFIYKSPAHRCFKNSKVHLAYEDHFRASNQSESLSRSHFQ